MCKSCEINPVYILTNKRRFCKRCFSRYIERRVLRAINRFSSEKSFFIKKSEKSPALIYIFKRLNFKINKKENKGKTANSNCIDDTAVEIIAAFMSRNMQLEKLNPSLKKEIMPFYFCLDKEIKLYASLHNIKLGEKAGERGLRRKVGNFLAEMEKKHPEIKNAIVNSLISTS